MVIHVFDIALGRQKQSDLHSELQVSQAYTERPCLKAKGKPCRAEVNALIRS